MMVPMRMSSLLRIEMMVLLSSGDIYSSKLTKDNHTMSGVNAATEPSK